MIGHSPRLAPGPDRHSRTRSNVPLHDHFPGPRRPRRHPSPASAPCRSSCPGGAITIAPPGHCGPWIGFASLPRRRVVARRKVARAHVLASAMPLPRSRDRRAGPHDPRSVVDVPCRRRGPVGNRCGRARWAGVGLAPDPSGSLPARPVDFLHGRLARDGLCNFGHKANDRRRRPDLPWPHVHYSLGRIHPKHRSSPSDDG